MRLEQCATRLCHLLVCHYHLTSEPRSGIDWVKRAELKRPWNGTYSNCQTLGSDRIQLRETQGFGENDPGVPPQNDPVATAPRF